LYKHVCKSCSKSIEVLMAKTVCICSCKTIMTNVGIVMTTAGSLILFHPTTLHLTANVIFSNI
jgi:hypothetical protein